jgi:hypothetical protein
VKNFLSFYQEIRSPITIGVATVSAVHVSARRLSGSAYARSLDRPPPHDHRHISQKRAFRAHGEPTRRPEVGPAQAYGYQDGPRQPVAVGRVPGELCSGKHMRQPVRVNPAAGGIGLLMQRRCSEP